MTGYRAVICDLDGTVYRSGVPFPGAVDALARVRAAGVRVLFVSNNPLRDAASYAERLSKLGIPTEPTDILTSGAVMARWLRAHTPGARVLLLGEDSLRTELTSAGANIVDRGEEAEVVVASFDRTFRYATWLEAFRAIRAGARFVATNPDPTCPVEGGEVPDCGGIIAALEATTGHSVEAVAGKPSSLMLAAALEALGCSEREVVIVGDRVGTDIELGRRGGVATALVLTGVTSRDMVADLDHPPTYVIESIAELPALVAGQLT
ncbi:HAD-IIA family hydrolase [Actinopolymorpha alba]|uniref:HAD-IIA family hydrolase n=1 Tax=Actinopolymorpha alba TaxID=533267 RepID=UPI000370196C|nr:HAD-IIA family hydrolase [Actinopolymorpha alba]